MTESDLSKYFWLAKEIEALEKELSYNRTHYIMDENIEITKQRERILSNKMSEASRELLNIEEYLNKIDDPEIRLILRLRYCMRMTWEAIGDEIFMSPSGALRKCMRFLDKKI